MNTSSESNASGYWCAAGCVLIWGCYAVALRAGVRTFDPWFMTAIMLLSSCVAGGTVLLLTKRNWREGFNRVCQSWRDFLMVTVLIVCLVNGGLTVASQWTSAGTIAIVGLSESAFTLIVFSFMGVRHGWKRWVGCGLILTSGLMVVGAGVRWDAGGLLVLILMFLAPFGNLYQQRLLARFSTLTVLVVRNMAATVLLLSFSVLHEPFSDNISRLPENGWLPVTAGLLVMLGGKFLYLAGMKRLGVPVIVMLGSTSPIITLLVAWAVLGETPTWAQTLGIAIMIPGVMLTVIPDKRPSQKAS